MSTKENIRLIARAPLSLPAVKVFEIFLLSKFAKGNN